MREVLENLVESYPSLRERIFEGDELPQFLNVFIDGTDVRLNEGLETPVDEGATVVLLPAVAGGESNVATLRAVLDGFNRHDLDAIMAHFADDATLTVQTDQAVFDGADEIRRMFTDFCDNSVSIFHKIKNIVIEPASGKVATEQNYIGELSDGTKNDMHNCNFFDVNADGQFARVIIWMAGTNPLK